MKLSVSSYSFGKYRKETGCTYLDLCDKAKALGFEGIEFIDLEGDDPLSLAREIRQRCENIGLPIVAYTVGADFLAEDIEAEVARVCACVDVCEALGAPLLRHDVCSKLPDNPLYSWEDAVTQMVPHIRRVTEYAAAKGVRTCTENHGYIFQYPERVEALIRAVRHPNYGWLCDVGNFLCVDVDPRHAVSVAARYTVHVHAKDFLLKTDAECPDGFFPTAGRRWLRGTIPGHGVVPVASCLRILKDSGYDGFVTLEFEGPEECLPALESGLKTLKAYTQ
ncbi:MAG: sugar phosphate isomerase/epimerase [Clostridia bacterium]|nr:sugar phosphate isomerase/epimerase [Clostridia bacterium]